MTPSASYLPGTVTIRRWHDPVVEAHGFGPHSEYLEYVWLGRLGPTSTWLYRRLATELLASVDGTATIDVVDLAVSLGVGRGLGRNSKIAHAIDRLLSFDAARWIGSVLETRAALGPLPEIDLQIVSHSARLAHKRIVSPTGRGSLPS